MTQFDPLVYGEPIKTEFNPLDYGELVKDKVEFNPSEYGKLIEEPVEEKTAEEVGNSMLSAADLGETEVNNIPKMYRDMETPAQSSPELTERNALISDILKTGMSLKGEVTQNELDTGLNKFVEKREQERIVKPVESVEPITPLVQSYPEKGYNELIKTSAEKYKVPFHIAYKLFETESQFDPKAKSEAGAEGIAQFMPKTSKAEGVDPWNPESAIPGALKYLKKHYDKFGNWESAVAAYNAGRANVIKYGGVPPWKETQEHNRKIMEGYEEKNEEIEPKDFKDVDSIFNQEEKKKDLLKLYDRKLEQGETHKQTFFDWLKDRTVLSPAKASNIVALSEDAGISIEDAAKHYTEMTKSLRSQPTKMDFYSGLMTIALAPALIVKPIEVLAGLSTFMSVAEAENFLVSRIKKGKYTPLEGKQFSDLAPYDLNENTKTTLEMLDILGKASISSKIGQIGGKLWKNLSPRERGLISIKVMEDVKIKKMSVAEAVKSRLKEAKKAGTWKEQMIKEQETFNRAYDEPKPKRAEKTIKTVKPVKVKEEKVKVEKVNKEPSITKIKPLKDKDQQNFVDKKVEELGSLKAVENFYSRPNNVSNYARQKAVEVYGGEFKPLEVEKEIKASKDPLAVVGKGIDIKTGKVIPYEKEWQAKKGMKIAAQKAGLDITGYKVFEQGDGWVYKRERSKWDGKKEFPDEKKEDEVNLHKKDYLEIVDMSKEELKRFSKKELLKTAKQLDSEVVEFGGESKTIPKDSIDKLVEYIGDRSEVLHIQEKSKIDMDTEKTITFGKGSSKNENTIPFKVKHYADKLKKKLGKEFEVKEVKKGFIVEKVDPDKAKIITVTRVTNKGDSIQIKINPLEAKQEIKDNNVVINRLKGLLDCL